MSVRSRHSSETLPDRGGQTSGYQRSLSAQDGSTSNSGKGDDKTGQDGNRARSVFSIFARKKRALRGGRKQLTEAETKMLQAARQGDFETVMTIIETESDLNLNATDDTGQTVLHHAVMKSKTDIIPLLIARGAYVDYPNQDKGRTALHVAVSRNKPKLIETLLYCGADFTVKDQAGNTPDQLCETDRTKTLIEGAKKTSEENAKGDIHIEAVNIKKDSPGVFQKFGLVVEYTGEDEDDIITLVVRRHTAEYCTVDCGIEQDEEYCSEIYEYRLCGARTGLTTPVIISVPILGEPKSNEEVLVRTNTKETIPIDRIYQEKQQWMCSVSANLQQFSSLVIVSHKKTEKIQIGQEASTFTSTVDERVELQFPKNTFEKEAEVKLQITEPPAKEKEDQERCKDIISATSFYSVDAGGQKLNKPVNFRVPLPLGYLGQGQIMVCSMEGDEDTQTEDSWRLLDVAGKVAKGMLTFDVDSFSVKVGVEATKKMKDALLLKRQLSDLYRRARIREYKVRFFAMAKRDGNTNTFSIIIEACLEDQYVTRRQTWQQEGYDEPEERKDVFTVKSRQEFVIKIPSKNFRFLGSGTEVNLQFHKNRDNYQTLMIELEGGRSQCKGNFEVVQYIKHSDDGVTFESVPEVVVTFPVELQKLRIELPRSDTTLVGVAELENKIREGGDTGGENTQQNLEFTSEDFLRDFMKELEGEWYKILVLMGVSFHAVEYCLKRRRLQPDFIWGLLRSWRDASKRRDDLGIPLLLSATRKGGRRDIGNGVQIKLMQWYKSCSDKSNPFYKWVEKAYSDSNVLIPSDYPRPMSDSFLVLLANEIFPSYDVAQKLRLNKTEINDIMDSNNVFDSDGLKMMKMLTLFREKVPNKVRAIDTLIQAFQQLKLDNAKNYTIMSARSWAKRTAERNDKFMHQVEDMLRKYPGR